MKQLLTLTLVAVLGFAIIGCNKTEKVNASATAASCDQSNCDPADCDLSKCSKAAASCSLQGTPECPMAAAKAANAKPAAAGDAKTCCSTKAKAKPAAAGDAKTCCSTKAKAKPAAVGKANCDPSACDSAKKTGCPFSGGM
jgi:hypothetical protein